MDRKQIEIVVLTVIEAVLKLEVNPDSSRRNTPQWDSLKHIEIAFAVEDELGIQFSEGDLIQITSVATIVDLALARYAP
jgi:acyl carrier protein